MRETHGANTSNIPDMSSCLPEEENPEMGSCEITGQMSRKVGFQRACFSNLPGHDSFG